MTVNEMFYERYPAAVLEHQIQVRPFNAEKTKNMRGLNPEGKILLDQALSCYYFNSIFVQILTSWSQFLAWSFGRQTLCLKWGKHFSSALYASSALLWKLTGAELPNLLCAPVVTLIIASHWCIIGPSSLISKWLNCKSLLVISFIENCLNSDYMSGILYRWYAGRSDASHCCFVCSQWFSWCGTTRRSCYCDWLVK